MQRLILFSLIVSFSFLFTQSCYFYHRKQDRTESSEEYVQKEEENEYVSKAELQKMKEIIALLAQKYEQLLAKKSSIYDLEREKFFIEKAQLEEELVKLDQEINEVKSQKDVFEERYKLLTKKRELIIKELGGENKDEEEYSNGKNKTNQYLKLKGLKVSENKSEIMDELSKLPK